MTQRPFMEELERIQGDFASGLAAFDLVHQMLAEKTSPTSYTEALYVIYTYLQSVHQEMLHMIQTGYQKQIS